MRSTRPKSVRCLILVLTLSLACTPALAQSSAVPIDSQESQRKQKKEKNPLLDWAEKDVAPIITKAELDAWKLLKTNEEREAFIGIFWGNRDPDPETEENEYREGYYERLSYVNEHFSSGKPGYLTDRGRIYLVYGKPDEIESHPSGGNYQRPSYEGYGSIMAYPFEIWFYRYLPNVGSGLELEFVDPTGSGEYRLASDKDEKNAGLHVPGATLGQRTGPMGGSGYRRAQDNPFDIMIRNAALFSPPPVNYDRDGVTNPGPQFDTTDPIGVEVRTDVFRQSDQTGIAAITIQTSNNDLVFVSSGGIQTARLNIWGRITSASGRRIATFEEVVTTSATTEELVEMNKRRSAYQKVVPLPPGAYKVSVAVRDLNSGSVGRVDSSLNVPKFDNAKVTLSSIVLATRLEELGSRPQGQMFSIGDKKVLPNISGEFRIGQGIGVYAQVYNAEIDQTTLRPAVEVTYAITRNGTEVYRQGEDWRGMSEAGQRLTLARIFSTSALTPGTYQIVITVKDLVNGQTLSQAANFTVTR